MPETLNANSQAETELTKVASGPKTTAELIQMQTQIAQTTPFDFIDKEHFQSTTDREAAKALFKRSVSMVEIEVFYYCNRLCWFCPNVTIDRRTTNKYMPVSLYNSILNELAEIDYSGFISYSRYNEPLADKVILERLCQASATLPNATLHANTNGDYLTPDYLAGINFLASRR